MKLFRYYFTSEEMKKIEAYESTGFESIVNETDFNLLIDYYIYNRSFDEALKITNKAINLFDNPSAMKLRQAQIKLKNYKPKEAMEIIEHLEQEAPELDNLQITKAYTLTGLDKANVAFEIINAEINKLQDQSQRSSLIGEVCYFFKINMKYDYALQIQRNEYERTGSLDWVLDMALTSHQMENYKQAIELHKQFLDEHPFSEESWLALARSYIKNGDYDEAIDAYEYALAIEPHLEDAIFEKATALFRANQFDQAANSFSEYLFNEEVDSYTEPIVHFYLGASYTYLKKFKKAYTHFEKAADLGFNDSILYQYMAILLNKNNQKRDALYFLIVGKQHASNEDLFDLEIDAVGLYFDIQVSLGNYTDAERIILNALQDDSEYFSWKPKLALLQIKHLNKTDQAIQLLFEAIDDEDNPDSKPFEALATCLLIRDYKNDRIDMNAIMILLRQAEEQGEKHFRTIRTEFPEYKEIPQLVEFFATRNLF